MAAWPRLRYLNQDFKVDWSLVGGSSKWMVIVSLQDLGQRGTPSIHGHENGLQMGVALTTY